MLTAPARTPVTDFESALSYNGTAYVSNAFAKAYLTLELRHIRTRPYTPSSNVKAEIFIQALLQEWAYSMPFQNYQERNQ